MTNAYWVILPAAGVGARMQANVPKQYLPLDGKYLIDQTIERLLSHEKINNIAVGLSVNDAYWLDSIWANDKRVHRYIGGKERSDTVLNGLSFIMDKHAIKDEFVLVHDAARPLISLSEIDDLLANNNPIGALLAMPAKDTIKQASPTSENQTQVEMSLDRQHIWHAQTPQKFKADALITALIKAKKQGLLITDESSAFESLGQHPDLVEGKASNFKVTLPIDLVMAKALLPLLDNH
ncbi:2-C-methyl-D-erythritol 4-phosphate cytidylyltransferase [Marinomonas sp. MED121]|uniref:2-C-methyl-D-erythritol 4-phosphate cytidylyltransferase n=1 Tax=Marinomonas sp. MED121 TaxID=314277 RepID=UPI000069111F|nr:2-C-methyl-D-erythritol 4-phosphate cytidylyltransferase [Marinomonas sp. MED121]EAQ67505.1 2-C-methyl-D-erythritol 4-phosphate cytidylyltransferase [Marinomonas sp. MED121]